MFSLTLIYVIYVWDVRRVKSVQMTIIQLSYYSVDLVEKYTRENNAEKV